MSVPKFRVVYAEWNNNGFSEVREYFPTSYDTYPNLGLGYTVLGVSVEEGNSFGGAALPVMERGYMRDLVAADFYNSTLPNTGDRLWCQTNGQVGPNRISGQYTQIYVGYYLGGGVVDVTVRLLPAIQDLTYVNWTDTPVEKDVLFWESSSGFYEPRRISHTDDLIELLVEDDHPMYAPMRWSEMLDESGFSPDGNGEIAEVPEKATREDDDLLLLEDSSAAYTKKRATASSLIALQSTTVTGTSHTAAAAHAILVDDDTAGSAVTVTLPPAASCSRPYHIKKLGTTANVVIDGDGSELIDGALTQTMTVQYDSLTLVSDGAAWWIL